jgi:hypothetical protein
MGLIDSPLCRRCGAEKETTAHVVSECEALATLRHTNLGSFLFDPEDVRSLSVGAIWNFIKGTGLPCFGHQFKGHEGPVKKSYVHRDRKGSRPLTILFYPPIYN